MMTQSVLRENSYHISHDSQLPELVLSPLETREQRGLAVDDSIDGNFILTSVVFLLEKSIENEIIIYVVVNFCEIYFVIQS